MLFYVSNKDNLSEIDEIIAIYQLLNDIASIVEIWGRNLIIILLT